MNLEQRIEALEKQAFALGLFCLSSFLPGTQITRVLDPANPGVCWCLAVGGLNFPKLMFYGKTIAEALDNAEKDMRDRAKD